jgi:hypothetical protein
MRTVYVEKRLRKLFSVLSSVSVTFLSKWRLRELPTATGFSVKVRWGKCINGTNVLVAHNFFKLRANIPPSLFW